MNWIKKLIQNPNFPTFLIAFGIAEVFDLSLKQFAGVYISIVGIWCLYISFNLKGYHD